MNIYIFSLLAIFFLIPTVYVIPSSLTVNGKLLLVIASFVLAEIGIFTFETFVFWQALLLLLLLVMMSAYIMNNRVGDWMFKEAVEGNGKIEEQNFRFESLSGKTNVGTIGHEAEISASLEQVTPQRVDELNVSTKENENDDFETASILQSDENPQHEVDTFAEMDEQFAQLNGEIHNLEKAELEQDDLYLEIFEPIGEIQEETRVEKIEDEETLFEKSTSYLAEIEEMLESDEDKQPETTEKVNEELTVEEPSFLDSLDSVKDRDHSIQVGHEKLELFQLVIAQLKLAKFQLSCGEYEDLLLKHLDNDLPLNHRYEVSSLLINHYFGTGQIGKLKMVLAGLKNRFSHLPAIMIELDYLSNKINKY